MGAHLLEVGHTSASETVSAVVCAYFLGKGNKRPEKAATALTIKTLIHQESDAMVHPTSKLQMKLSESEFPFSKRMLNFFKQAEIFTIHDLIKIPLSSYTCFRGFKIQCRKELLAYIEFEHIEELFEEFSDWKSLDAI